MSAAPASVPLAAPWPRAFRAQLRVELLLLLRQGENLLVILVLPVLLLVLFTGARILPAGAGPPVRFLMPGVLTVALMSTGMVTLGISTAYQRYYGVLKRLGGSPLPRSALVGAKASAMLAVEALQVLLLWAIASFALGWRLQGSPLVGLGLLLLGAACFAGLGLTMAGWLRAELTLGGANGLYLLFLVLGGVVLPVSHLPALVQPLARVLPVTVLCSSLRSALEGGAPGALDLGLLLGWTALFLGAMMTRFRWE